MSEGGTDFTLLAIGIVVGVIILCALSCFIYKYRSKYECVNSKLVVRESYKRKKDEELKALSDLRRQQRSETPQMVNSAIMPVSFNVYSPNTSQRSYTS